MVQSLKLGGVWGVVSEAGQLAPFGPNIGAEVGDRLAGPQGSQSDSFQKMN